MQRHEPARGKDRVKTGDWASLGQHILQVAQEAIHLQRQEERQTARPTCVPFLRLVRSDENDEHEASSAGTAA